jgi:hypothetical protein
MSEKSLPYPVSKEEHPAHLISEHCSKVKKPEILPVPGDS